jgi:hypothetical protein
LPLDNDELFVDRIRNMKGPLSPPLK